MQTFSTTWKHQKTLRLEMKSYNILHLFLLDLEKAELPIVTFTKLLENCTGFPKKSDA